MHKKKTSQLRGPEKGGITLVLIVLPHLRDLFTQT